MKRYNTVLFKNNLDHLYMGVKEDSKIVGFSRLKLTRTQEMQIRSTLVGLELNEFLLIEVEASQVEDHYEFKITPFTCGTVSESDVTDVSHTTNLYEMQHDVLLKLFNNLIPENFLRD